jgi:peptidoglycan/xylan/chitin deacetylase (PgdA/CDA1 family)
VLTSGHDVVSLDEALDRLDAHDERPTVVLTFDDGFADVYEHAWPRLAERQLPFTIYLTAGLVGDVMTWEGSTADSQGAPALTWDQLGEMASGGRCAIENHTFSHVGPSALTADELDRASDLVERLVGRRPRHFAYTWGIEVPAMRPVLAERFRSAATGRIGRNRAATERLALRRVPVRRSDPLAFFEAKLRPRLVAERVYDGMVRVAKRVGARG